MHFTGSRGIHMRALASEGSEETSPEEVMAASSTTAHKKQTGNTAKKNQKQIERKNKDHERNLELARKVGFMADMHTRRPRYNRDFASVETALLDAIDAIPAQDRAEYLFPQLSTLSSLRGLWGIAGYWNGVPPAGYDVLADVSPDLPDDVVVYDGLVASPTKPELPRWFLRRFQVAFFNVPELELDVQLEAEYVPVRARLVTPWNAISRRLFGPLYASVDVRGRFGVSDSNMSVSASGDAADVRLSYSTSEAIQLGRGANVSETQAGIFFPPPKRKLPRWPYGSRGVGASGELVDYWRWVAPGVFVGQGWRERRADGASEDRQMSMYVLVRRHADPAAE